MNESVEPEIIFQKIGNIWIAEFSRLAPTFDEVVMWCASQWGPSKNNSRWRYEGGAIDYRYHPRIKVMYEIDAFEFRMRWT